MVVEPVLCPTCQSIDIVRHGLSAEGSLVINVATQTVSVAPSS
jgi:hypothetical protein